MKKITHDYICDNCDKKAKFNIQNDYHSYAILPDGNFNEINAWEGDVNNFFCQKHFDEDEK